MTTKNETLPPASTGRQLVHLDDLDLLLSAAAAAAKAAVRAEAPGLPAAGTTISLAPPGPATKAPSIFR